MLLGKSSLLTSWALVLALFGTVVHAEPPKFQSSNPPSEQDVQNAVSQGYVCRLVRGVKTTYSSWLANYYNDYSRGTISVEDANLDTLQCIPRVETTK